MPPKIRILTDQSKNQALYRYFIAAKGSNEAMYRSETHRNLSIYTGKDQFNKFQAAQDPSGALVTVLYPANKITGGRATDKNIGLGHQSYIKVQTHEISKARTIDDKAGILVEKTESNPNRTMG